jgi:NADH:ubiquinone oxidoreductase subunit 6 (subunit J)
MTVSVSSYLLYATAALSLIGSLISLSTIGTMSGVYRDAYSGTAAEGTESIILIAAVGGVVINVLFAAGLAILGVFNSRGRQGARITTWVLGGITLCCSGIGLAGTAATSALETSGRTGGPSAREVQDRLAAALPSWYGPTTTTLSVLMLLALLGALILLALPPSNAYFRTRRQQGGWDPSMPYPGYPYPGQPYPGSYPGQQPYPGQPYLGQPYPGQGQQPSGQPQTPPPSAPPSGDDPSGQQFGGPPPPGHSGSGSGSQAEQPPHTGSIPPTDPWSPPDDDQPKPPSGPSSQP